MRNVDRTTKLLLGLLGAGVWALLAQNLMTDEGGSAIAAEKKAVTFDEITVKSSEAIGFSVSDSNREYDASFFVRDRIPLGKDILKVGTTGPVRIQLSNENGDSSLVLRDPAGKDRVVLSVDREGQAGFEMRNASGKVVFPAP